MHSFTKIITKLCLLLKRPAYSLPSCPPLLLANQIRLCRLWRPPIRQLRFTYSTATVYKRRRYYSYRNSQNINIINTRLLGSCFQSKRAVFHVSPKLHLEKLHALYSTQIWRIFGSNIYAFFWANLRPVLAEN